MVASNNTLTTFDFFCHMLSRKNFNWNLIFILDTISVYNNCTTRKMVVASKSMAYDHWETLKCRSQSIKVPHGLN